ncbi:MAG: hypothetical protein WCI31_06230 [Prolixibacteraceae bacterium]
MPSLNFQSQFAPGILAMLDKNYAKKTGIKPKTTTIRAKRKHAIKKGDTLFLFKALRTIQCQRLGTVMCRKLEEIFIDENREGITVKIDNYRLSLEEAQLVAETDGFESLTDFVHWFKMTHGLPFVGDRIHFTTTYDRKYFCNKSVKDRGYKLKLETTQKTILITSDQVAAAKEDRYIRELAEKHNYGVQIVNPLFQ